jgi:hypothetical protein
LEKGINDNSMERAIVIHAADYVSDAIAKSKGRIGRSWGCPAVRPEIARRLIEAVLGGTLVLAYYPDRFWMQTSKLAGPIYAPLLWNGVSHSGGSDHPELLGYPVGQSGDSPGQR